MESAPWHAILTLIPRGAALEDGERERPLHAARGDDAQCIIMQALRNGLSWRNQMTALVPDAADDETIGAGARLSIFCRPSSRRACAMRARCSDA